jgi:hypothetical protein
VTFSGNRNIANAIERGPAVGSRVIAPNVIEPLETVGATETAEFDQTCNCLRVTFESLQEHFVVICYDGVIRSGRRKFPLWWRSPITVGDQHLPSVVRHLKLVQVKCCKVIHEVTLNLTPENVDLRS